MLRASIPVLFLVGQQEGPASVPSSLLHGIKQIYKNTFKFRRQMIKDFYTPG
jgi:hypothetical protein